MRFRDDIDPAKTWVTSDSHFGHKNIVGFCHRPEDQEHVLMEEWGREVPEEDSTLLHLGDLAFRGNAQFRHLIAPHLTGARKLLILGNHDKSRYSFYRTAGFQIVRPFAISYPTPGHDTGTESVTVSFSHYPWSDSEEGGPIDALHWRLHGHIHNSGYSRAAFVPFLRNHINLSVEQTKYRPVNLKLLLDAVLLGTYPETTQEQLDDRDRRREANRG